MLTFDYSPLTGPADASAVAALRRESIAEKIQPAAVDDRFLLAMNIVGLVVASGLLAVVDLLPSTLPLIPKVLYSLLVGVPDVVFLIGIVYGIYRLRVRWTQFYRAKQFARVNGMTYAVSESKPTWDSVLFALKVVKSNASNVFTATTEPVFEAGNYHFENRVDKKLVGVDWGTWSWISGVRLRPWCCGPHPAAPTDAGGKAHTRGTRFSRSVPSPIASSGSIARRAPRPMPGSCSPRS